MFIGCYVAQALTLGGVERNASPSYLLRLGMQDGDGSASCILLSAATLAFQQRHLHMLSERRRRTLSCCTNTDHHWRNSNIHGNNNPSIHLHAQELQPRKPPRNGSPRGLGEALEPFQFDIRHMATWMCLHTPIATLGHGSSAIRCSVRLEFTALSLKRACSPKFNIKTCP